MIKLFDRKNSVDVYHKGTLVVAKQPTQLYDYKTGFMLFSHDTLVKPYVMMFLGYEIINKNYRYCLLLSNKICTTPLFVKHVCFLVFKKVSNDQ